MERLLRAAQELEEFRTIRGWHSAMFEALAERRLGYTDVYSEAELLDFIAHTELLAINIKDSAGFKTVHGKGDTLPSVSLNAVEWEKAVTVQHKKVSADYRQQFKGGELKDKLKELDNARDVLLNLRNRNAISALLEREHYANYYRLLGLDPAKASEYEAEQIARAYKTKAFNEAHPDKGGSTEAMQELNSAYEILSAYKQLIDARLNPAGGE